MNLGDRQNQKLLIEDAGRVSLLAHDIRSTFSELQSTLNALLNTPDISPDIHAEITRVAHASAHMGQLLDEVSEAVFHDHQKRPAPIVSTTPRAALAGLVQRWQRITERLGTELILDGGDVMPETANLDMLTLERVLSNLVSNALHHAGPGPICIQISRSGQDDRAELMFRIRDAGPGFPPTVLASASSPIPIGAGEPGSGFGLRIAFEAAQRLNGRLTLQNPPDGGAEACFSVPYPAPAPLPSEAFAKVTHLPEDLTILLVEDSAALRMELRHNIETMGFTVIEAHDGAEALDRLMVPQNGIDLVFLDIELPLFSGLQVLSKLRERGVTPPPVVAVTSHVFEANRHIIFAHGAKALLSKPVNSQHHILNAIATALGLQKRQPQAKAPDSTTAESHKQCLLDLVKRLPHPVAQRILLQMSADLKRYLDEAYVAAQNLSNVQNFAVLTRATHSLSGLFATACMSESQHQARTLSQTASQMNPTEIIAVLGRLRQNATDIQTTIHSVIHREMDNDVPPPNFNHR